MPFRDHLKPLYSTLIVKAVETANEILGKKGSELLYPQRADDDITTKAGWLNILDHLCTAQIVLSVLTKNNANVFYEMGIAHATQPITRQILIANKSYTPKFDLQDLIFYKYGADLNADIEPLAERITQTIGLHKFDQEKLLHRARMLLGPYEFEVIMDHHGRRNFTLHTSRQGRDDYKKLLETQHRDDPSYLEGIFERHVVAVTNLLQQRLLGLHTHTKLYPGVVNVQFSYHWTELGNAVLHFMDLISKKELEERREGMPPFFREPVYRP